MNTLLYQASKGIRQSIGSVAFLRLSGHDRWAMGKAIAPRFPMKGKVGHTERLQRVTPTVKSRVRATLRESLVVVTVKCDGIKGNPLTTELRESEVERAIPVLAQRVGRSL